MVLDGSGQLLVGPADAAVSEIDIVAKDPGDSL